MERQPPAGIMDRGRLGHAAEWKPGHTKRKPAGEIPAGFKKENFTDYWP
jgi:hypothetical protein